MDAREFSFVLYGLAAVWLIVTGYVVSLAMRDKRLRSELDRVRRMVEDSGKK